MKKSALKLVAFYLMATGPALAQGQPQPASQLTPATSNLVNCAIARNAGDVRWLNAIAAKTSGLSPSIEKGAQVNALQGMLYGCSVEGADASAAIGMIRRGMKFHPNSINAPRRMDALAECLAKSAPKEAIAYLEASDKNEASNGSAADVDYQKMFGASSGCGAELDKIGNKIQENELYSKLNWLLRAAPALASEQALLTKSAGQ